MRGLSWLALAWLVSALVMAAVWYAQRGGKDAGVVDVVWTLCVGAWGLIFAAVQSAGMPSRRWLLAAMIGLWALRLAGHIVHRLRTQPEDGRYLHLKAIWGDRADRKLFVFFQFQAVGVVLFAAPLLFAAANPLPWSQWDGLAIALWFVSWAGEAAADRQLSQFRAREENRGRVCDTGLWRYSRHPNYFFEWLHWWCYVLLAVGSPVGWLTVLAPVLMLYFLLFVTGIPPTEAQALRSRGAAYRRYQQTTSAFFPWFPRHNGASS